MIVSFVQSGIGFELDLILSHFDNFGNQSFALTTDFTSQTVRHCEEKPIRELQEPSLVSMRGDKERKEGTFASKLANYVILMVTPHFVLGK